MKSKFLALAAAAAVVLPSAVAHAQATSHFPSKLVRIVVPFPPGGGIDILVRSLGAELSQKWGQPVIIVPTTQEQGFGYFKASIWYGLFAPAGTPAAVVQKVNADVAAVLSDPKFVEKNITARSLTLVASSSKQLQDTIREEVLAVKEMIQAANIQPE